MKRIKYNPRHLRRKAIVANLLEIFDTCTSLITLGNYRTKFMWNYITKNIREDLKISRKNS